MVLSAMLKGIISLLLMPDVSTLPQIALPEEQVTGDRLETRYIPLAIAQACLGEMLLDGNPKLHDIGSLWSSIQEYGLLDCGKWDSNLNGGRGGIIDGNGTTETVVKLLVSMQQLNQPAPKNIPETKEGGSWGDISWEPGEWCVPMKFGGDLDSEESALAASLGMNNLVMAGGNFELPDFLRLYDQNSLNDLLSKVAPVEDIPGFDGNDIDALLKMVKPPEEEENDSDEEPSTGYFDQFPKSVVLDKEGEKLWQQMCDRYDLKNATRLVMRMMEELC